MISKLSANMLNVYLDKCISEEQSAFFERRSIQNNAIIAIHAKKRITREWRGDVVLKIYIRKQGRNGTIYIAIFHTPSPL